MAPRLLIRGPVSAARLEFIRGRLETGWEIEVWDREEGPDALARKLANADALVSMGFERGWPPAPRLELLHLPGAGLDQVDFDALPDGATVCNVYEHEIGIAEYVVLALLEWEIRLCRMDAGLRRGEWLDGFVLDRPLHGELCGKRVGFVGYGRIARETARRLRPFGVHLMARTRSPERGDGHLDDVAGMDRFDDLLIESDFVVVTCPLTPATEGLIGADELRLMKETAVLVNVARGPVVDERALYEACRDRTIGGAVIDTWYEYPVRGEREVVFPSRFPFQELDNVIMTPHASGWSAGLLDRRWTVICANLDRLARGEPLVNVAAPER